MRYEDARYVEHEYEPESEGRSEYTESSSDSATCKEFLELVLHRSTNVCMVCGMGEVVELEPRTDPEVDIEVRLREVCGHLNVLNAQLVELAAEALATGSWAGWGVKSLSHWLTWQAGISSGRAQEVVRLAEARDTHPAVMSAFAAGALSVDQAAIATKAPAYLDEDFAELAPMATVSQLRVLVRAARPAPPRPPVPADEPAESLSGWFDDDGRYHLRGEFDPDHGRIIESALSEARDALFQAGHTKVSWAEAMVEMARRSMDQAPPQRQERFRANWFIDPADPIPARWSDGLAVPDWLRDMLLCDGTVSPVFTDAALPVSVGRTQYAVPDRTRRLVLQRDKKCRIPWCTQTRWLQVHHIIHHEHGGPTDTVQPGRYLPSMPPAPSQGHARHLRQRRRPQRAHLHRRQRASDRPRRPPHQTHRATTATGHTLRAPTRRTAAEVGHLVPRPTTGTAAGTAGRKRRLRARTPSVRRLPPR